MQTLKRGCKGEDVKVLQKALHILEDGIFGKLTDEAVREFQRSNSLRADGIVGEQTWAKINGSGIAKSKRVINEIIVHCSATPEGRDFTVADITRWHKKRGFTTIGYHYVIYRDGSIHNGRDINVGGAHCIGHNAHSIGICYIGGCKTDGHTPKDTRTEEQKKTLLSMLKKLRVIYPKAKIHGHRDFANKACPSFDATKEFQNI